MSKNEKRREQIKKEFANGIQSIIDWYMTGAVDCSETRKNINKDLDWLVEKVEKKYSLRKIPLKLRCRTDGNGFLTVRFERADLA